MKPKLIADVFKKPDWTAGIAPPPAEPSYTFQLVTLEQLDTSHHPKVELAVNAARTWARRKMSGVGHASLVLIASSINGDLARTGYGCGKTHIARACLHMDCYYLGNTPVAPAGKFFQANAIIQRMDADTPASVEIGAVSIVVVDDVGTEQNIPYVPATSQEQERQRRYYKLVNHCYVKGISLIMTANLSVTGFAQRIGGRAWSRLQEMCPSGQIVDLMGVPDWRIEGRS
jgi:DNA replication protein DnaC